MTPDKLAVWWLCSEDIEIIGRSVQGDLNRPGIMDYMCKEILSMHGRPLRGRLWVSSRFGDVSVPWNDTAMARRLNDYGGIVIERDHMSCITTLPGIITDMKLNQLACELSMELRNR